MAQFMVLIWYFPVKHWLSQSCSTVLGAVCIGLAVRARDLATLTANFAALAASVAACIIACVMLCLYATISCFFMRLPCVSLPGFYFLVCLM